jgi:hypothetical protein
VADGGAVAVAGRGRGRRAPREGRWPPLRAGCERAPWHGFEPRTVAGVRVGAESAARWAMRTGKSEERLSCSSRRGGRLDVHSACKAISKLPYPVLCVCVDARSDS